MCKRGRASVKTHRWHHTAGADAVIEARPALVVGVLALVQHVLVAAIVGLLVGHPTTAIHLYRVAAAEVVLHLRTVTTALIVTTLEVPVFVEDNLQAMDGRMLSPQRQLLHALYAGLVICPPALQTFKQYLVF